MGERDGVRLHVHEEPLAVATRHVVVRNDVTPAGT